MSVARIFVVHLHAFFLKRVAASHLNRVAVEEALLTGMLNTNSISVVERPIGLEDQWWLAAKKGISSKVVAKEAHSPPKVREDVVGSVLEPHSDGREVLIRVTPGDKIRLIKEFEEEKKAQDLEQHWWLKDSKAKETGAVGPMSHVLKSRHQEGQAPIVVAPQDEIRLIKTSKISPVDEIRFFKELKEVKSEKTNSVDGFEIPARVGREFVERDRYEDKTYRSRIKQNIETFEVGKVAEAGLKFKGGVYADDGSDLKENAKVLASEGKLNRSVSVDDGSNMGTAQALKGAVSVDDSSAVKENAQVVNSKRRFKGGVLVDDDSMVREAQAFKFSDGGRTFQGGVSIDDSLDAIESKAQVAVVESAASLDNNSDATPENALAFQVADAAHKTKGVISLGTVPDVAANAHAFHAVAAERKFKGGAVVTNETIIDDNAQALVSVNDSSDIDQKTEAVKLADNGAKYTQSASLDSGSEVFQNAPAVNIADAEHAEASGEDRSKKEMVVAREMFREVQGREDIEAAEAASLDDTGFRTIEELRNTDAMERFLQRLAWIRGLNVTRQDHSQQMARFYSGACGKGTFSNVISDLVRGAKHTKCEVPWLAPVTNSSQVLLSDDDFVKKRVGKRDDLPTWRWRMSEAKASLLQVESLHEEAVQAVQLDNNSQKSAQQMKHEEQLKRKMSEKTLNEEEYRKLVKARSPTKMHYFAKRVAHKLHLKVLDAVAFSHMLAYYDGTCESQTLATLEKELLAGTVDKKSCGGAFMKRVHDEN